MKSPIIILGPGRCGSTLIQRIVNVSPEIVVWGEHAGFLVPLAQSYEALTKSEGIVRNYYQRHLDYSMVLNSLTDYTQDISWLNSFDQKIVRNRYRNLVIGILNAKGDININQIHFGFKEIRYTKSDRALDMWLELFPDSLIIFSVRDPFDVIKSMILSWNNPEKIHNHIQNEQIEEVVPIALQYARRWNDMVGSFKYWQEEKKIRCYIEKYEDLVAQPAKSVESLFKFLGVKTPENVLDIMKHKAGTPPNKTKDYRSDVEKLVYDIARKPIWDIVGETARYFAYDLSKIDF